MNNGLPKPSRLEIICECYPDTELLSADGFDAAIIGVVTDFNAAPRIAYSVKRCLDILVNRDGMTDEEAREYFDFNIGGSFVGEQTPVWCEDDMFETNLFEP